jgi:hypothetical protein
MTAQERWNQSVVDRVEHADICWLADGGCSAPFGEVRPTYCAEGQRLADIELAAYEAWRTERIGLVASSAQQTRVYASFEIERLRIGGES